MNETKISGKFELMVKLIELSGGDVAQLRQGVTRQDVKCPWHDDRQASAQLYASGFYRCHGCGVQGGDAWEVLYNHDGLTFTQVEEWFAQRGVITDRPGKRTAARPHHAEPWTSPWSAGTS